MRRGVYKRKMELMYIIFARHLSRRDKIHEPSRG